MSETADKLIAQMEKITKDRREYIHKAADAERDYRRAKAEQWVKSARWTLWRKRKRL